ncbi:hypothetical protein PJF56_01300 [Roseofilum sp. BLCC_M91]|uniref:Uncharacterized protein n=1 Tax=Roseofilum halophilum BLCC-M91 TaxID=3022259 RepID=A0ABT7BE93_9CYAN|nr:hypothetical protein [Roseofilum halophilum]MDJ1177490.1 hypothetical protein [Roseofilum halophilum BLCC-M91]
MSVISQVVQEALTTGYLSIESENQLRSLLQNPYGQEDFHAFRQLQMAAMMGNVKQESRELLCGSQISSQ